MYKYMKLFALLVISLISVMSNAMYVTRAFMLRFPHVGDARPERFGSKRMSSLTALQAQYIHAREERIKHEKIAANCFKKNKCDISCFPYDDCRDALKKTKAEEDRAFNVLNENRQVLWAEYKGTINLDKDPNEKK